MSCNCKRKSAHFTKPQDNNPKLSGKTQENGEEKKQIQGLAD